VSFQTLFKNIQIPKLSKHLRDLAEKRFKDHAPDALAFALDRLEYDCMDITLGTKHVIKVLAAATSKTPGCYEFVDSTRFYFYYEPEPLLRQRLDGLFAAFEQSQLVENHAV
jgi:hypothetical protein